MHDLGIELVGRGHSVILACPAELMSRKFEISLEDGITVLRIKTGKIKGSSKALRALREIWLATNFWIKARQVFEQNRCDLIVFYSPTIFWAGLVLRLKRLWQCRAYLVLRDIFPQWALDAGLLRKGPIYWFFRREELRQYAAADVIGVLSPANLDYFESQAREHRPKAEVLYNWIPLAENPAKSASLRARLRLEGKIVFFFGGNIGVAQDMDNIVRLATALRDESDIFFLLVGEGSEVTRLQKEITKLGLSNIHIHPPVTQQEYISVLSEFDVGLITLDAKLKTHNFPGKLTPYLYCSLPVLASVNPGNDLKDVLEEYGAGFCHVNGEDERLKQSALRLARDSRLRRGMGENGRKLLELKFSVDSAVDQVLGHVGELSGAQKSLLLEADSEKSFGFPA
jgi:glycosyltransferase involved in cell wall biosynthesis